MPAVWSGALLCVKMSPGCSKSGQKTDICDGLGPKGTSNYNDYQLKLFRVKRGLSNRSSEESSGADYSGLTRSIWRGLVNEGKNVYIEE